MTENKNIEHSLEEENIALARLLSNVDNLRFIEQRKEIVDLINEMLKRAHGDQEGPVRLLPEVEISPENNTAMRQSLTGEKPVPHITFK